MQNDISVIARSCQLFFICVLSAIGKDKRSQIERLMNFGALEWKKEEFFVMTAKCL